MHFDRLHQAHAHCTAHWWLFSKSCQFSYFINTEPIVNYRVIFSSPKKGGKCLNFWNWYIYIFSLKDVSGLNWKNLARHKNRRKFLNSIFCLGAIETVFYSLKPVSVLENSKFAGRKFIFPMQVQRCHTNALHHTTRHQCHQLELFL